MIFQKSLLILSLVGLGACSTLSQRSLQSGYFDSSRNESENFYQDISTHKQEQARSELGLSSSRSLNKVERTAILRRMKLKQLEDGLQSSVDRKQYYSLVPFMNSDHQKIAFLQLPNYETRRLWAFRNGITPQKDRVSAKSNLLIKKNDVGLGMNKNAVKESWGDPDSVEIAGNPMYSNERWSYFKVISSEEGYNKQTRVIYFEHGRVSGWETLK